MTRTKIAITQGDINGIGYELVLKNFIENKNLNNIVPVIYGSSKILGFYKKQFGLNVNSLNINDINDTKTSNLYVINCNSDDIKADPGQSNEMAGLASYQALEKASEDLLEEKMEILVNLPINVKNINAAGFKFNNISEYLAKKFRVENYIDILVKEDLRIALVENYNTTNESHFKINKDIVTNKIKILNTSLKNDFLVDCPKIAVLAVSTSYPNSNNINKEINSLIEKLKEEDIFVFGTYNADDFFGELLYRKFDAVLAINYEQAFIPFKILANETGVKYTAGFPFVQVAPINEVAYHNVGKNITNEISFRHSINFAIDILNKRKLTGDLQKNKMNSEDYAEDIKKINTEDE